MPDCAKPRVHRDIGGWYAFFDSGSAALKPRSKQIVDEFVGQWKQYGGRLVEISGHVDAAQAEVARSSLALERANVVKSYLVAQGISPSVITTTAYGAARPLVPVDHADPQNRRAEFIPLLNEPREFRANVLLCRAWIRDHCFTPSPRAKANARMCNAALDAS